MNNGILMLDNMLQKGLIAFSLIRLMKSYVKKNGTTGLFDLRSIENNAEFYEQCCEQEIKHPEAAFTALNELIDCCHTDPLISVELLEKAGLMVDVTFYKESGKYYEGGLVDIGDNVQCWDAEAVKQAIITNQGILSRGWEGNGYHFVVKDTLTNHEDINYLYTCERLYLFGK